MQGRLGEHQSLSKQFRDAEILLALTLNEAEFIGLPVNRSHNIDWAVPAPRVNTSHEVSSYAVLFRFLSQFPGSASHSVIGGENTGQVVQGVHTKDCPYELNITHTRCRNSRLSIQSVRTQDYPYKVYELRTAHTKCTNSGLPIRSVRTQDYPHKVYDLRIVHARCTNWELPIPGVELRTAHTKCTNSGLPIQSVRTENCPYKV